MQASGTCMLRVSSSIAGERQGDARLAVAYWRNTSGSRTPGRK
jgi:hypothetical protein